MRNSRPGSSGTRTGRAILAILIAPLVLLISLDAMAQASSGSSSPATSADKASSVEPLSKDQIARLVQNALQRKALNLIATIVPRNRFVLQLTASGVKPPELPSHLLLKQTTAAIDGMSLHELRTIVSGVQVTLTHDDTLPQDLLGAIEGRLVASMSLDKAKGDTVDFKPVPFKHLTNRGVDELMARVDANKKSSKALADQASQAESDYKRLEGAVGSSGKKASSLIAENERLHEEIRQLDLNKSDFARNVSVAELEARLLKHRLAIIEAERKSKSSDSVPLNWMLIASFAVAGVTLVVGVVMMALSLKSSVGVVGESMTGIAAGIDAVGNAVTAALSEEVVKEEAGTEEQIVDSEGSLALVNPQALEQRLSELRTMLKEQIAKARVYALSHISSLLSAPASVELGVATLEVLGKELALQLFSELNGPNQKVVSEFMRTKSYSSLKDDVLLRAAENLRSAMFFAERSISKGVFNEKIAIGVTKMANEDLVSLIAALKKEEIARLLCFVEPERIADLLGFANNETYQKILEGSLKMQEKGGDKTADQTIEEALEQHLGMAKADVHRRNIPFYQAIVESAGESVAPDLIAALSAADQRIKQHFDDAYVSLESLFRLTPAYQGEICDFLSNRDLAVLLVTVGDERGQALQKCVDQKRLEVLEDELIRAKALSPRKLEAAAVKVKRLVIKQIKSLKGDAPLSQFFSKASDAA